MRRAWVVKRVLGVLALLVLLALGALVWALQQHPSLQPYADLQWKAPGGGGAPPTLKVTFLGVSTVLLDDGETALMTDGFFSRPDFFRLVLGVSPNESRINKALAAGKITSLDALLVAHSHHDHAMDVGVVAMKTGAIVIGTRSVAR